MSMCWTKAVYPHHKLWCVTGGHVCQPGGQAHAALADSCAHKWQQIAKKAVSCSRQLSKLARKWQQKALEAVSNQVCQTDPNTALDMHVGVLSLCAAYAFGAG